MRFTQPVAIAFVLPLLGATYAALWSVRLDLAVGIGTRF